MDWRTHIDKWTNALEPFLAEPAHIDIRGPLTEGELDDFEEKIAYEVPDKPYSGYIEFNLEAMHTLNSDRTRFIYGDEPEYTKKQWEQAFPFVGAPNGDCIALDVLANPDNPPVIYLNHEEPEKQVRLADSFDEFIESWFSLGCVGNEGWILRHFIADTGKAIPGHDYGTATSKIDPDCQNSIIFRKFFGL